MPHRSGSVERTHPSFRTAAAWHAVPHRRLYWPVASPGRGEYPRRRPLFAPYRALQGRTVYGFRSTLSIGKVPGLLGNGSRVRFRASLIAGARDSRIVSFDRSGIAPASVGFLSKELGSDDAAAPAF